MAGYISAIAMRPCTPSPCFRSIYDHMQGLQKLKTNEHGALRCSGYIDQQGNELDACVRCAFYEPWEIPPDLLKKGNNDGQQ